MGRGKFKGKPNGQLNFSTPEQLFAGTSSHPEEVRVRQGGGGRSIQRLMEIENPNLLKSKNEDMEKKTKFSRREREVIEKQKRHEQFMKLREQQRAEATKKRQEQKIAKEQKKLMAPK
ncbi:hypothetical protein UlMin_042166 [Ulmus minor]